ncbi:chemotaxis response regulator protein-glutamate methylesterase, partial [Arthrospira sp. O9.13F]
ISTGGPQALAFLIPQLPENLPVPVVVVLHMPVGYTNMYAQRLNRLCSLDVKEAQAGDLVRPGEVLIAQAGHHLSFKRNRDQNVVVHLHTKPFDLPHRPSVDVMFQSAAEIYKERVLGVVMTGMGSDGKQGAAWIKSHGGSVFTEAEESCVVYGMPRTVVEAGLSDRSIPLNQMAKAIVDYL